MKNFNILLCGAGQLGSRYLQGMVNTNANLSLTVVDPSVRSLNMAKSLWSESGGETSSNQIRWSESLPSDLSEIDIAFVLTSSKGRADLVQSVADLAKVRFWVLEKVLAQSKLELNLIQSVTTLSEGAWVNTPRRMMKWHQSLKEIFNNHCPLTVSYSSELWGLACNSIHFIDLVAWCSGEKLLSININGLDNKWIKSKRPGYYEITGELLAHYSGGTSLLLSSKEGGGSQPLRVEMKNGVVWLIDEHAGVARSSNGDTLEGNIEFQSKLSSCLVDKILKCKTCELPTLDKSSEMHAVFLDAMVTHWNLSHNSYDDFISIT